MILKLLFSLGKYVSHAPYPRSRYRCWKLTTIEVSIIFLLFWHSAHRTWDGRVGGRQMSYSLGPTGISSSPFWSSAKPREERFVLAKLAYFPATGEVVPEWKKRKGIDWLNTFWIPCAPWIVILSKTLSSIQTNYSEKKVQNKQSIYSSSWQFMVKLQENSLWDDLGI
jgi:hypothetical protein